MREAASNIVAGEKSEKKPKIEMGSKDEDVKDSEVKVEVVKSEIGRLSYDQMVKNVIRT